MRGVRRSGLGIQVELHDCSRIVVSAVRVTQHVAVHIARYAGEIGKPESRLHGQARDKQLIAVITGHLVEFLVQPQCRHEGRGIVEHRALIQQRRRDADVLARCPKRLDVDSEIAVGVDAAFDQRPGCRRTQRERAVECVMVDVAAVVAILGRDPQREYVRGYG